MFFEKLKNIIKQILTGILLISVIIPVIGFSAEKPISMNSISENDSIVFDLRIIPQDKIDKYLADDDFDYHTNKAKVDKSFFKSLLNWLRDKLGLRDINIDLPYFKYIFMFLILGLVVYLLLKNEIHGVFQRTKNINNNTEVTEIDNLHNRDFNLLINDAIKSGDFKMALRFLFIKLLIFLNQKEYISWENDKTNSDYINEIKNKTLANKFTILSNVYDHVWYGDQNINMELFNIIQKEFSQFYQSIDDKKK